MGKTGSVKDTRLLRPICGKSGPEGSEDIRDGGHAFFLVLVVITIFLYAFLLQAASNTCKKGRKQKRQRASEKDIFGYNKWPK